MEKIVLSEDEKVVIEMQLRGEIGLDTATEEQQQLLMGVIHKAEALMDETGEEPDGDLIAWFYEKYKAQVA